MKKKVSVSWSGGKDCMMALHRVMLADEFEVCSLHMVIDSDSGRVGMHGIPTELIEEQAHQLGFKLDILKLKASNNHQAYEGLMREYYSDLEYHKVEHVVFGDIFLEDLKTYRKSLLKNFRLKPIFPLWLVDTKALITEFLNLKFKAVVCAVDATKIKKSKVGAVLDSNWIGGLSEDIDVCGENGEFHTFVFDGPIFNSPVRIKTGMVVSKDYSYLIQDHRGVQNELLKKFYFQDFELDKKLNRSSIS
ncbi:MAG: diphthine--ammonia ligase [Cyclobacteriaceae bacterium]